jgi:fructokinase
VNEPGSSNVLCFGEALWDCLPQGRFPGGASLNVACHLARLGSSAWLVSGVGDDADGNELLERMRDWRISVELVGRESGKPTGTVRVSLDNGAPTYDIVEDVAWDYIDIPASLPDACTPVGAIVYGSLAQRTSRNRDALQKLCDLVPGAMKVFDVNLRPPHDSPDLVRALMQNADLIKLNDAEASALFGETSDSGELETIARTIAEQTCCDRICITAGSNGAGLLDMGSWVRAESHPAVVRDTVGAGDAFLAALVDGLLSTPGQPAETLERASRLAGFVASSDGATPDYASQEFARNDRDVPAKSD